jgi:hypothetical protein
MLISQMTASSWSAFVLCATKCKNSPRQAAISQQWISSRLFSNLQIQASWRVGERRKTLKFVFRQKSMKLAAQMEELRWQLESLEFAEKFKGLWNASSQSSTDNSIKQGGP